MRIGIDARFLTHPQSGGFKTYTKNLVAALAEVDDENEYLLYVDRPIREPSWMPDRPNFHVRVVSGALPMVGMPWREQIGLAREASRDRLDLLHSLALTAPLRMERPSVVTIHDTIWLYPPTRPQSSGKRALLDRYYALVPRWAAHKAAAVITVSCAAKESIVNDLGLEPAQIHVTYEAASPIFRRLDRLTGLDGILENNNLSPNYILAFGSADPRKNVTRLVQAYAQLPQALQQQHQLAVVWTHPYLVPELAAQIAALKIDDRVRFLRQVSDEDLVLLYNAASAFAFPSLSEGFGLPPLEAMACGTPIVAANNSSIPEVVGDAALLSDARDVDALSWALERVLSDGDLRDTLIRRGLKRAATFSWARCARETIGAYRQVLSS